MLLSLDWWVSEIQVHHSGRVVQRSRQSVREGVCGHTAIVQLCPLVVRLVFVPIEKLERHVQFMVRAHRVCPLSHLTQEGLHRMIGQLGAQRDELFGWEV